MALVLIFSQAGLAEGLQIGVPTGLGLPVYSPGVASHADFTAAQFLEAQPEGTKRDASWPKRLTFKPVEMDAKEAKAKIQGQWAMVFHCSGKPMPAEWLAAKKRADGFINPGAELVYEGSSVTRYRTRPRTSRGPLVGSSKIDRVNLFEIQSQDSKLLLVHRSTRDYNAWASIEIQLVQVLETGEILIEYSEIDSYQKCPDGSPIKYLSAPVPRTS